MQTLEWGRLKVINYRHFGNERGRADFPSGHDRYAGQVPVGGWREFRADRIKRSLN